MQALLAPTAVIYLLCRWPSMSATVMSATGHGQHGRTRHGPRVRAAFHGYTFHSRGAYSRAAPCSESSGCSKLVHAPSAISSCRCRLSALSAHPTETTALPHTRPATPSGGMWEKARNPIAAAEPLTRITSANAASACRGQSEVELCRAVALQWYCYYTHLPGKHVGDARFEDAFPHGATEALQGVDSTE